MLGRCHRQLGETPRHPQQMGDADPLPPDDECPSALSHVFPEELVEPALLQRHSLQKQTAGTANRQCLPPDRPACD